MRGTLEPGSNESHVSEFYASKFYALNSMLLKRYLIMILSETIIELT